MLTIIDEHTRECLAIVVARRLTSDAVWQALTDLAVEHGPPDPIRSDNVLRRRLHRESGARLAGATEAVRTLFIERGSPGENGDKEACNGKLRDALLGHESFQSLQEAQVLIERWRRHDNSARPHSALGSRPPAPEATWRRPIGPAYAALRHPQPGAPEHVVLTRQPGPSGAQFFRHSAPWRRVP